ncbi:patatin-like phospholipase family protein [bacterium]|nr:patatin-like phospholipase family protein [bacterium]
MPAKRYRLNLALQGGGAHGAFTWGVLDRLLDEEDIDIVGISGTSAGAMNGAMLINGYMKNGREGAKELLDKFWREISEAGAFAPWQPPGLKPFWQGWNIDQTAAYNWYDIISRTWSPYQLNPFNINPLKDVLERCLDRELLHSCSSIRLFVAATAVRTGRARIFECDEITVDALLASACIPFIFQAIEIDGQPYWDGGYMGNPAIWPLLYRTDCEDVMLVQINPLYREELPDTAAEIINRLNEINFNSSLIAEMRAVSFVSRLVKEHKLDHTQYKDVKMHMVEGCHAMDQLNASSKMNVSWDFFQKLKTIGHRAMGEWLKTHKEMIGKESSVNINDVFLYDSTDDKKRHVHASSGK